MNIDKYLLIQTVYSDPESDTDARVWAAVTACLRLECRDPEVLKALDELIAVFDRKGSGPSIERAEELVATCWELFKAKPPGGPVFKG